MATDFRGLSWAGSTIATAQASAPAGFTTGHAYEVKSIAIDNTADVVYVLILNDNHYPQAVAMPTSGTGPFTFQ
jgi:hypothetical protein